MVLSDKEDAHMTVIESAEFDPGSVRGSMNVLLLLEGNTYCFFFNDKY